LKNFSQLNRFITFLLKSVKMVEYVDSQRLQQAPDPDGALCGLKMARISSATSHFMLWWGAYWWASLRQQLSRQIPDETTAEENQQPVTTSPISFLVLLMAELCNERRLSQPSIPELSCSWLASCDLLRHRTYSLFVPIDAQPERLYASFSHPFPQFAAPVAYIHRQKLIQSP
jgi:hypothetical protein